MARYAFGGGLSDWTMALGDEVTVGALTGQQVVAVGGQSVTFWSMEQGGVQYTDLINSDSVAVSEIVSSDGAGVRATGQIPWFLGPENVTTMWAQAGVGGPRALMVTTDAADATSEVGMILPPLSVAGPVSSPRQGTARLYNDTLSTLRLDSVRASVGTAPTTAYTFDIKRNGVSVYANPADRPRITVGATTSGRLAPTDMVVIAPGDYLTVDVSEGSGAENLTVQIAVTRAS